MDTTNLKSLVLVLGCFGLLTASAKAQVFTGQIIEEYSRVPVPNAVVELQDTTKKRVRTVSADENGYYILKAPEAKRYHLHVRRVGYVENTGGPFPIGSGDTLNVNFRILKETTVLDEITVSVEAHNKSVIDRQLERVNFDARKKNPFGFFYAREEIQEKNLFRFTDLLRGTPGLIIRNGQVWNWREKCPMKVVINGLEAFGPDALKLEGSSAFPTFNIDNYVNVDNVIGVESYTSQVNQPTQFGSVTRCGLLLVWTL